MNDTTKAHVRKILLTLKRDAEAHLKRVVELEAQGTRIVDTIDGGATIDWRTKQVLLTGEEQTEEVTRRYGDEDWLHIDHIWEDLQTLHVEPTEGIPQSLSEALQDWVGMRATPDDEVADFVGWTVEEVRACRE